jgi:hypothetical protein
MGDGIWSRFLSDWWRRDEERGGTHLTEYTLAWAGGRRPVGLQGFELVDFEVVIALARQAAQVGEEHRTPDPDRDRQVHLLTRGGP